MRISDWSSDVCSSDLKSGCPIAGPAISGPGTSGLIGRGIHESMTYGVGMRLNKGLVFMSDTRTNAGVDDISQVRKMRSWHMPGERVITLMSAGNLATTQAVVSLLDERTKAPEERHPAILEAPSMFAVATLVGTTLRNETERGPGGERVGQ